jgi:membrane associated rhomboid family serine protease
MDFELIAGVSAIFVIMAVIEIFKSFGLNQKYSPIFAVILGLVFSFAMAFYGNTVEYESAIKGLIVGLSAVGLYSGAKNTAQLKR